MVKVRVKVRVMIRVKVKVRVRVNVKVRVRVSITLSLFLLPEVQSVVVTRISSVITLRPAILRVHNPKPVTP